MAHSTVFSSLALALLPAVISWAAAMPTPDLFTTPMTLDLSTVLNKTVCPIEVVEDFDKARVPQRIRVLKCAKDPNKWCAKMHVPKQECCQHTHDFVRLACVEVQEVMEVYFPEKNQKQLHRMSVGCTCVMEESVRAEEAMPSR